MKLGIEGQAVETGGLTGQSRVFNIELNSKAFKVLTDGLYRNKIQAVVREISCNASDAHIEAKKKTEPFLVHLPNQFEPYFSVRDYGPGLSHDDCVGLYTTLFKSTKDQSNEQVGAFGLGSKSPFSYTSAFTCESFFNGKKYTFACFLENNVPTVNVVSVVDTTEPNGLNVVIPVRAPDINEFISQAKLIYTFFETRPIVEGAKIEYDFDQFVLYKSDNYIVYDETKFAHKNPQLFQKIREMNVIQGNVAYPLRYDSIPDDAKQMLFSIQSQIKSKTHGLVCSTNIIRDIFIPMRSSVIFIYPIGSLEVTPSREELSMTPYTVKGIINNISMMEEIFHKIFNDVVDAIDSAQSRYDKIFALRKCVQDLAGGELTRSSPLGNGNNKVLVQKVLECVSLISEEMKNLVATYSQPYIETKLDKVSDFLMYQYSADERYRTSPKKYMGDRRDLFNLHREQRQAGTDANGKTVYDIIEKHSFHLPFNINFVLIDDIDSSDVRRDLKNILRYKKELKMDKFDTPLQPYHNVVTHVAVIEHRLSKEMRKGVVKTASDARKEMADFADILGVRKEFIVYLSDFIPEIKRLNKENTVVSTRAKGIMQKLTYSIHPKVTYKNNSNANSEYHMDLNRNYNYTEDKIDTGEVDIPKYGIYVIRETSSSVRIFEQEISDRDYLMHMHRFALAYFLKYAAGQASDPYREILNHCIKGSIQTAGTSTTVTAEKFVQLYDIMNNPKVDDKCRNISVDIVTFSPSMAKKLNLQENENYIAFEDLYRYAMVAYMDMQKYVDKSVCAALAPNITETYTISSNYGRLFCHGDPKSGFTKMIMMIVLNIMKMKEDDPANAKRYDAILSKPVFKPCVALAEEVYNYYSQCSGDNVNNKLDEIFMLHGSGVANWYSAWPSNYEKRMKQEIAQKQEKAKSAGETLDADELIFDEIKINIGNEEYTAAEFVAEVNKRKELKMQVLKTSSDIAIEKHAFIVSFLLFLQDYKIAIHNADSNKIKTLKNVFLHASKSDGQVVMATYIDTLEQLAKLL